MFLSHQLMDPFVLGCNGTLMIRNDKLLILLIYKTIVRNYVHSVMHKSSQKITWYPILFSISN